MSKSAFPRPRGQAGGGYNKSQTGMSLREYIAIEAMNALLIKTPYMKKGENEVDQFDIDRQRESIVYSAVQTADLLIKELNKK